jgi:hypothetical protein
VKRKKKEHEALGAEDETESEVPDDEVDKKPAWFSQRRVV